MIKSFIKPVENINISVSEIIQMWGAKKISSFISIGANDGIKNDPISIFIKEYNWNGIMVEPMPSNFKQLKKNYAAYKNVSLVNACITTHPGNFSFYYINNVLPAEPDWYDQVGSLDKETFYKNISVDERLLERVGTCQVEGITFDKLMGNHNLNNVDLIMIDTEGHDYKILSSINLQKYNPKIIIFEYEWLTNYEMKLAKKQLKQANYRIFLSGLDCIAIQN